jgi:hypothetical protein
MTSTHLIYSQHRVASEVTSYRLGGLRPVERVLGFAANDRESDTTVDESVCLQEVALPLVNEAAWINRADWQETP